MHELMGEACSLIIDFLTPNLRGMKTVLSRRLCARVWRRSILDHGTRHELQAVISHTRSTPRFVSMCMAQVRNFLFNGPRLYSLLHVNLKVAPPAHEILLNFREPLP